MKNDYVIFTDASADILPADVGKPGIRTIPMEYTFGEESRICQGAEQASFMKQFYDGQRNGGLTRTSLISPQSYEEYFSAALEEGHSVLYLSLSSGLSGTYNASCMVASELKEKYKDLDIICVDTLSATAGMGVLISLAVQNRENGMSIRENADFLENARHTLCHWFMVDDLMYLKRGGRLPAATAVIGAALGIKPILMIDKDGRLENFAKERGAKSGLKYLVKLYDRSSEKKQGETICIVHADNDSGAEYLEQAIKELNPTANISRVMLSPIIGAHTGPGMCAVVNFGDANKGLKA